MRELIDANGVVKTFSYQARIKDTDFKLDVFLHDYAALYGMVERKLYADFSSGKDISKLKSEYLLKYGITARQFNALRIELQGKLDSIRALQCDYIQDLKVRIKKIVVNIKKLHAKPKLTPKQVNKLHQKNRLLVTLHRKLRRLEQNKKSNKVCICFGSKRLFRQQFNLQANNLENHEEWLDKWQAARCSQFYIIGSKDETMGNQSCIATINDDQSFTLRIRVPTVLIPKYGKYIIINNLAYAYGSQQIAVLWLIICGVTFTLEKPRMR